MAKTVGLLVLVVGAAVLGPSPAGAAEPTSALPPGSVSGSVSVSGLISGRASRIDALPVSTTSVRLRWSRTGGASKYVIRVSTDRSQRTGVRMFKSKKNRKTVTLPATNPGSTYFYRVLSRKGSRTISNSRLMTLNLLVGPTRGLTVASGSNTGLSLQWVPGSNAQVHRITVATNPQFSGGKTYVTRSAAGRFAPPDLSAGVKYYFRVQAENASSKSSPADTSAAMPSRLGSITVGTFNVNGGGGGGPLPNSSARMDLLAGELTRGEFDVVGLQEAVSSMRKALIDRVGNVFDYSRAANAHGWNETGGQILYRPSKVRPAGIQGLIALPTPSNGTHPRHAVYQLFDVVSTGAQFMFVSTHLSKGEGKALSDWRARQSSTILDGIVAVKPPGAAVIVVGDMNSNRGPRYVYDAPAQIFKDRHMPDALDAAIQVQNAAFNSFNALSVSPPKGDGGGYYVDHVFVTGNVPVLTGEVMVRLSGNGYSSPFASDHNPVRAMVQIPY